MMHSGLGNLRQIRHLPLGLTCQCRNLTSSASGGTGPNADYVVSPVYNNRNPRNLEKMALDRKRLGWKLQAPRRDYYHKLIFDPSIRNTEGRLEHWTGDVVLKASTKEWAIRQQLYSCNDVSASEGVGHVLAQRCLESGITEMFYDDEETPITSEKIKAFLQPFKDLNISLKESPMIGPEERPGIDYDGHHRYAESREWRDDYQER